MTKEEFDNEIDKLFDQLKTCPSDKCKKNVLKQIYQISLDALDKGLIENTQAAIIICGTRFNAPQQAHQIPFEEIIDLACDLELPSGIIDDDQTVLWQRLRGLVTELE